MAAAYASLVSLLNTMDQIQIHPLLSTCFSNYPNESIRQNINFFLDFVEKYSDAESTEAEDLVRRIAVVAHEAEDIIEVQAADLIRAAAASTQPIIMPLKLQQIVEYMDYIKEKIIITSMNPASSSSSSSSPPATLMVENSSSAKTTTTMVGFDAYLEQLLDQLTGSHHSGRRILPIVGMGGIGKTTLARNVYDNLLTLEYFYVRAWVTVSQEFSVTDILLQALSCLGESTIKKDITDAEIGEILYKTLFGRKYLIVLDDVWSVEAWEKIKFFFPENNNGSRIVVTTRQSELVGYFGSSALALDFLDDKNSWHLFCEKTFRQQGCPPELVQIGKKIVEKCKGLPLAIIVIGGLLRKSPSTQEYWKKIAKDKNMILNLGEGNKPLSLLYLSYKHLSIGLKSCFLYLGLFPEDHRIDVSQLIKLWVAEGFIKPNADKSLEEIAENYIKELADRNLILVGDLRLNKKLKTCYIHDLVRDLCLSIAKKEKYFCVQRSVDGMRHIVVDERNAASYPPEFGILRKPSIFSPVIFEGQRVTPLKSRLLRVLFCPYSFEVSFQEVNLHFLSCGCYELPSSISLLWRLQTLVVNHNPTTVAPSEIWKMPQLRHIEMVSIYLPHPPPSDDDIVLQNLQTLGLVVNLIFTEEVCKRIPNIKDLQIHYDFRREGGVSLCCHLQNVGSLSKLESLRYSCNPRLQEYVCDSLQKLKLPSSLKELILQDCNLVWSDMAMIASLPHLQILKLLGNAVVGGEWNFVEEEFICLKYLQIGGCDVIKWNIADPSSFPVLETLSLVSLSKLDEVPPCVGEIPTLETISMAYCSESATISAVKILEEQESLGNEDLQLQLQCFEWINADMLRHKIQELGFTCQNLHISSIIKRQVRFPVPLNVKYHFAQKKKKNVKYHFHFG